MCFLKSIPGKIYFRQHVSTAWKFSTLLQTIATKPAHTFYSGCFDIQQFYV